MQNYTVNLTCRGVSCTGNLTGLGCTEVLELEAPCLDVRCRLTP